jgi:hypothetical protein
MHLLAGVVPKKPPTTFAAPLNQPEEPGLPTDPDSSCEHKACTIPSGLRGLIQDRLFLEGGEPKRPNWFAGLRVAVLVHGGTMAWHIRNLLE